MIKYNKINILKKLKNYIPTGLYLRSLLIVTTPIILVQVVIGFVFIERYWYTVTHQLSHTVVNELSLLVDLHTKNENIDEKYIIDLAHHHFNINISFLSHTQLPKTVPPSFFTLLNTSLSQELHEQVEYPFWIDTASLNNYVDLRIQLPDKEVMRSLILLDRLYATNSYIFILWITSTSIFLLMISIFFLRSQIKPIERLVEATESFGKGHYDPDFKISGSSEIRRAFTAFTQMRDRINAHIKQRTIMLAGVSHDLRTPLTRMKLQLSMLPKTPEIEYLRNDIKEMENMLEDYLAFTKDYQEEKSTIINLQSLMQTTQDNTLLYNSDIKIIVEVPSPIDLKVKPRAFQRCLDNLINNACHHASNIHIVIIERKNDVIIRISDDGIGIPVNKREDVFRPFFKLDSSRQTQSGSSGLGLSIARDIARGHGGDIILENSIRGGLQVDLIIPRT